MHPSEKMIGDKSESLVKEIAAIDDARECKLQGTARPRAEQMRNAPRAK
jgi:hypothetical protein